MKIIGFLVLVIGLIGLAFSLGLDTAVLTSHGGRVHNIGLINERQNYLIVSIALSVVGAIVCSMGFRNGGQRLFSVTDNGQNRNCPYCAEQIKAQAVVCRFCSKNVEPLIEVGTVKTGTVSIKGWVSKNRYLVCGIVVSVIVVASFSVFWNPVDARLDEICRDIDRKFPSDRVCDGRDILTKNEKQHIIQQVDMLNELLRGRN